MAATARTEELSEQIERLRSDLSSLSELMEELIDRPKGAAGDQAEDLIHRGKRAMHSAVRRSKEAISGVEGTIADNPWASVAVAFGLGIVLGRLLRR